MLKIGFIDYYLDEWHANSYPKMIRDAVGDKLEVAYAYGQIITKALLEAEGVTGEDFLLVSNDFHLSRIKLLWERAWGDRGTVSTLAAPVSHAPSRVQMFLREPLALVKSFLLDR